MSRISLRRGDWSPVATFFGERGGVSFLTSSSLALVSGSLVLISSALMSVMMRVVVCFCLFVYENKNEVTNITELLIYLLSPITKDTRREYQCAAS